MQFRVLNRQDLAFIDGGFVRERSLDYDYIANNESSIKITHATVAMQGDIIAIIETHGAYCVGCITSVDNESLQIKFKDCRELVNDSVLNPFLDFVVDDKVSEKHDVVATFKKMLIDNFVETADPRCFLPLRVRSYGTYEAVWETSDEMVALGELIALAFEKYNIVFEFSIDFDRATVGERRPGIIVEIYENQTAGHVVKDNIYLNEFEYSAESLPSATACVVFDKDTKMEDSTWYLRADNTVTADATDLLRLLPRKTVSGELDSSNPEVTAEDVAKEKLVGNVYNHFISSKLDRRSGLLRREDMRVGDLYNVVLRGGKSYKTVYAGWKDGGDNYIQLVWGKFRIDYTVRTKRAMRERRK